VPLAVVTGGAGFIGSHAVEKLISKGYKVKVIDSLTSGRIENIKPYLDSGKCELINMDIRDLDSNSNFFNGAEFVLHFAGVGDIVPSIQKPEEYMSINVQGTVKVLELVRLSGIKRFVYAASSSCYGANPETPTSELSAINTAYPYALSKYLGELSAFHWSKVYGIEVNSIRIFNAYGTRSKTSGAYGAVFGVFLKQKLSNLPFTVVGNGEQKRDFIYVTDVAEAFILAGQSKKYGEVWNLGSNNPITINTLCDLIGGEKIFLPRRPGEPEVTWADNSKIKKDLGWEPQVTFKSGVDEILTNIDYWANAPLWDKASIGIATEDWFKFMGKESQ
jgi:UDP-glucose 4-epimerase